MRYCPPPQDDLGHYPHSDWEYQQGMREYEQSSKMNYFPEPQSDSYCYDTHTNDGWEGNCSDSHSNHSKTLSLDYAEDQNQKAFDSSYCNYQEPSSLDYALTHSFLHDPYQPQNSFHNSQNSLHAHQNITTTHPCPQNYSQASSIELAFEQYLQTSIDSWKEQETLYNKMDGYLEQARRNKELLSKEDEDQLVDEKEEVEKQEEEATVSSEFSMEKEVVEAFEPEAAYPQKPLEMTKELENSQPPQTLLNQNSQHLNL
ncbi:hypothetical protein AHAS_Ahas10G0147300 [Arachis hypogaea]